MIKKAGFSFLMSCLFIIQGFSQESRSTYKEAVENFNMGVQLGLQKDYEEALVFFDKAIVLLPVYSEAFLYRGLAKAELGDYHSAIKDYNISLEIDPQFADQVYYFRGIARANSEDHPGAILDYTRAIEINPDYVSFFQRGKSYLALDNYSLALQDFEISLRLNPGFSQGKLYRGIAYYHCGLLSEALDDLNASVKNFPNLGKVFYYRGKVYEALGNSQAAGEDLEIASDNDPAYLSSSSETDEQSEANDSTRDDFNNGYQLNNNETDKKDGSENIDFPEEQIISAGLYDHNLSVTTTLPLYGIQVASFTVTDNLVRLANSYHEKYDQPVFIKVVEEKNRKLYKIIIGGINQRQQAELIKNQLRENDFPDCFIIDFEQL